MELQNKNYISIETKNYLNENIERQLKVPKGNKQKQY